MKYQIHKIQQLRCDIKTAWDFFSSPYNLSRITPKNMGFIVLTDLKGKAMQEGMEIDYKLTPIFGIPVKWKTKIIHVDPYKNFSDIQTKGPYKEWHHQHEFVQNNEGVLMKDNLTYQMPFGLLGKIAHILIIKKKLKHIFEYRYQILDKMFNDDKQKL